MLLIYPSLRPAALHTCLPTDLADFWTHHGPQRRSARPSLSNEHGICNEFLFLAARRTSLSASLGMTVD